jgi:hypothetical protein
MALMRRPCSFAHDGADVGEVEIDTSAKSRLMFGGTIPHFLRSLGGSSARRTVPWRWPQFLTSRTWLGPPELGQSLSNEKGSPAKILASVACFARCCVLSALRNSSSVGPGPGCAGVGAFRGRDFRFAQPAYRFPHSVTETAADAVSAPGRGVAVGNIQKAKQGRTQGAPAPPFTGFKEIPRFRRSFLAQSDRRIPGPVPPASQKSVSSGGEFRSAPPMAPTFSVADGSRSLAGVEPLGLKLEACLPSDRNHPRSSCRVRPCVFGVEAALTAVAGLDQGPGDVSGANGDVVTGRTQRPIAVTHSRCRSQCHGHARRRAIPADQNRRIRFPKAASRAPLLGASLVPARRRRASWWDGRDPGRRLAPTRRTPPRPQWGCWRRRCCWGGAQGSNPLAA